MIKPGSKRGVEGETEGVEPVELFMHEVRQKREQEH